MSLRILLTNIRLAERTGTEIVVRDFAARLAARGHRVTVYSPAVGSFAEDVKALGIPVVDNLSEVTEPPDIIHGHHAPNTGEAIIAFPEAPAIWICHDSTSWFDVPPGFSQVSRIFAVDETCKARLVSLDGVPADRIEILPNAVDLARFKVRQAPLPDKPLRALSLVKHAGPTALIAEACRRAGIAFEAYGHGVARPIEDVAERCAEADVVFGTARTALEAMATGAAAILIDGRGFGGLVTTTNYDRGRALNFGVGMLHEQPTVEALIGALSNYDAADAAAVCRRVRQDADLEPAITRLERTYEEVIAQHRHAAFDPAVFRRQTIDFLRTWCVNLEPPGAWLEERKAMIERDDRLEAELISASRRLADIEAELAAEKDVSGALRDHIAQNEATIRQLRAHIDRSERSRSVRVAKALRRFLGRSRS